MNKATNSNGEGRKTRIFERIFQEWVFEVLLVVAVGTALVDGVLSLNGSSIV